jgi:hypothetical protein
MGSALHQEIDEDRLTSFESKMAMYAAYSHGDRIIGTFADVGRTRIWTTLAPISSSVNHPAHESSLNM